MGASRSSRSAGLQSVVPLTITLPNGLRVVTADLPAVHRVAIVAQLRVGSRYETPEDNGVSHLLEHMLYRGIPSHPTAHEQALAFEQLGGTLVAGTGSESGSLAVACPPSSFEATLELFARVFQEPLLRGLDIEKRIVREEILEDLDEDGTLVDDYDLLRATAFEGHPLGLPVIGTVEHIDRFDVARLRRHHEKHYVGAGSVITVVGPIDPRSWLLPRSVLRAFASSGTHRARRRSASGFAVAASTTQASRQPSWSSGCSTTATRPGSTHGSATSAVWRTMSPPAMRPPKTSASSTLAATWRTRRR